MTKRARLRPPGAGESDIFRALWLKGGPGRAWEWGQWARRIKPSDPRRPLAENVRARVAEIIRLYRKGADSRANVLVERLDAARGQAEALRVAAALRPHRRGKPKGALQKSTRLLIALRRDHPNDTASQLFERLRAHDQFFERDADTIICRRDGRTIKRSSFASLLSKLPA